MTARPSARGQLPSAASRSKTVKMRHGRKSKSKRFDGYKRHIVADLDGELILACAVTPANRPEEEAAPVLRDDIAHLPSRNVIAELHIDRGYVGSTLVQDVLDARREVICKPWVARNGKLLTKSDFHINMRSHTIRCPAREVERVRARLRRGVRSRSGARCPLRSGCTMASPAAGRTVSIARDEPCNIVCVSSSPLLRAANVYANESPSRIASHTWAESRVGALATSVFGKTCSASDAQPPSRISKLSTASSSERRESHWIQSVCRSRHSSGPMLPMVASLHAVRSRPPPQERLLSLRTLRAADRTHVPEVMASSRTAARCRTSDPLRGGDCCRWEARATKGY